MKFGRTLASIAAVFYTVKNAMAAFQAGYEFNAMLEDTKLSLAALLTSLYSYRDATGNLVSTQDSFNMAMKDATIIQEKLRYAGLTTAATYDQLLRAMTQAMAPASAAGVPLENMVDFVQRFVQLAQIAQVPMDQLNEEIRSFTTGVMQARMTRVKPLMEGLGLDNTTIKQMQASGKFYTEFMTRTASLAVMAEQAFSNWTVVLSNLKDAFQNLMGTGTLGSFEKLKQVMMDIFNWAIKFDEQTKKITLNPEIISSLQRIDSGIIAIVNNVTEFAKLVSEFNEAHPVFVQLVVDISIILLKITAFILSVRALMWVFGLLGGVAVGAFATIGKAIVVVMASLGAAITTAITAMTSLGLGPALVVALLSAGIIALAANIAPGLTEPIIEAIGGFELLGNTVSNHIENVKSKMKNLVDDFSKDPAAMAILGFAMGGMIGGTVGAIGGGIGAGAFAVSRLMSGDRDSMMIAAAAMGDPFAMAEIYTSDIDKNTSNINKNLSESEKFFYGLKENADLYKKSLEGANNALQAQPKDTLNIWDDKNIKALQTASSLMVSFNSQLSNISGNSMDRIISDFVKMNSQIDKTIFKMKEQNETTKLASSYEQKLKDIRDQIIAQEFEKRNREIYAYSLEGVPETLDNQYKKILLQHEEFVRKYQTAPSAGAMDELNGDPLLKLIENAKTASEVMDAAGKKFGQTWMTQIDSVIDSLDRLIGKVTDLGKVPPTGEDQLKKSLGIGAGGFNTDKFAAEMRGLIGSSISTPTGLDKFQVIIPEDRSKSGKALPLNNPGLLTYNQGTGQPYQYQAEQGGFVSPISNKFTAFPSAEAGFSALVKQVERRQSEQLSLEKFIYQYAPPNENNTEEYLTFLMNRLGAGRETNIAGLPSTELAKALAFHESQTKVVGEFQGMRGTAQNKLTTQLGMPQEQMEAKKQAFAIDKASMDNFLKINEIMKSSYSTLVAMNIPAEKQNEYSKKALNFELMIDQAKVEQLIRLNGLDEGTANLLRQNNNLLAIEKERAENINQQNRPLEQQNTWLNEINKHISNLASNSLLYTDQLRYQEESLNIQQKVSLNELEIWIKKNEYALKSAGFDEDRLRSLHKQSQEAEKLQLEMKKWETQGFAGGAKIYGVERANEASKRGAADFKALMDNLESGIGDMAGTAFIDSIRGKKIILEDMFWDLGETFVKQIMKMGVSRGFDLIGGLLNPVKSSGKEEGSFLSSLFGKGVLGTKTNPMYVEVANMPGLDKSILPDSKFDRTMKKAKKTAYSIGGRHKDDDISSELGGLTKLSKQFRTKSPFDELIRDNNRLQKDWRKTDRLVDSSFKGWIKEGDTYSDIQGDWIQNNQDAFTSDYINDYQDSFTDMTENMTSIWGVAQGLMTAAGVEGNTSRIVGIIGFALKAIQIFSALAKAAILMDAGRAAAAAFRSVWEAVPFPFNVVAAPIAAAAAFVATMMFGNMGGGGGSSGLGASPGMQSTGGGYTEGYHTGGVVGYGVAHAGLMVDERMIKAQVGEGIIKRSTMDLYSRKGITFDMLNNGQVGGNGSGTSNAYNINVTHSPTYRYKATEADYQRDAKHIVKAINKEIGNRGQSIGSGR